MSVEIILGCIGYKIINTSLGRFVEILILFKSPSPPSAPNFRPPPPKKKKRERDEKNLSLVMLQSTDSATWRSVFLEGQSRSVFLASGRFSACELYLGNSWKPQEKCHSSSWRHLLDFMTEMSGSMFFYFNWSRSRNSVLQISEE